MLPPRIHGVGDAELHTGFLFVIIAIFLGVVLAGAVALSALLSVLWFLFT